MRHMYKLYDTKLSFSESEEGSLNIVCFNLCPLVSLFYIIAVSRKTSLWYIGRTMNENELDEQNLKPNAITRSFCR